MVPESWFEDNMQSSEFFFRSPFRHQYFVLNTVTLVGVFCLFLVVLIKAWSHLSLMAVTMLVLALTQLVVLWRSALRTHFNLNIIFATKQADGPQKGSPLALALLAAGFMTNLGLLSVTFAVLVCLLAIWELIPKH
jgi:hypothetical protein